MNWFVILLGIVYLIILIRIYVKYNKDQKPKNNIEYYKEELEITPSEAAWLCNKDEKGIYLILADLLSLVNKRKLNLEIIHTSNNGNNEKEYVFSKNPNIDLHSMSNHEAMSYELFFDMFENKDKFYLSEFLDKVEGSKHVYKELSIKYHAIKYSIMLELEKNGIMDGNARKKMQKINSRCLGLGILSLFLLIISLIFKNDIFIKSVYLTMFFLFMLYLVTKRDEYKLTSKGADVLEKSMALKKYIQDYIIVDDKPIYAVNILDYYYTSAIAFEMADLGRKEFYKDSVKNINRKINLKLFGKFIAIAILIIVGILIFIGLAKKLGILLLFICMAILYFSEREEE